MTQTQAQWIQGILVHPITSVFVTGVVELMLFLGCFLLGCTGYCYWQKKKRRISLHMGLIRFMLLSAMTSGAGAGFMISDFYQIDGWDWLERSWVAGGAMALLLLCVYGLAMTFFIRGPQDIPWWFDPRLGDDDEPGRKR